MPAAHRSPPPPGAMGRAGRTLARSRGGKRQGGCAPARGPRSGTRAPGAAAGRGAAQPGRDPRVQHRGAARPFSSSSTALLAGATALWLAVTAMRRARREPHGPAPRLGGRDRDRRRRDRARRRDAGGVRPVRAQLSELRPVPERRQHDSRPSSPATASSPTRWTGRSAADRPRVAARRRSRPARGSPAPAVRALLRAVRTGLARARRSGRARSRRHRPTGRGRSGARRRRRRPPAPGPPTGAGRGGARRGQRGRQPGLAAQPQPVRDRPRPRRRPLRPPGWLPAPPASRTARPRRAGRCPAGHPRTPPGPR